MKLGIQKISEPKNLGSVVRKYSERVQKGDWKKREAISVGQGKKGMRMGGNCSEDGLRTEQGEEKEVRLNLSVSSQIVEQLVDTSRRWGRVGKVGMEEWSASDHVGGGEKVLTRTCDMPPGEHDISERRLCTAVKAKRNGRKVFPTPPLKNTQGLKGGDRTGPETIRLDRGEMERDVYAPPPGT